MKAIMVFLIAVVMVSAVEAKEKKFKWQGAQVLIPIAGEVPVIKDKLLVRSSISYIRIPSDGTEQFYSYMGPKWIVGKWTEKDSFWLSPQMGVAGNRTEDGSDALILSLWGRVSCLDGRFALFIETEGYLNSSEQIYYGYYCADYNSPGAVNVGFHAEQIDRNVSIGPHIGITRDPWRSELLYFACFQEDNYGHAVRITTGFSF